MTDSKIAMDTEKITEKKCRGRPPSFDREQLVAQVLDLFWERGYGKLSLNEVARATGLTRASLYNAFKTKEALFLEVFEQYLTNSPEAVLADICDGEPVGPALYHFFEAVSTMLASDSQHRGCLAVNCLTEKFPEDSALGTALAAMQDNKRRLFKVLMQKAIAQQELSADTDAEVTANMLQAFLHGLSMFSTTGLSVEDLQAMSKTFLKNIGFADPAAKVEQTLSEP